MTIILDGTNGVSDVDGSASTPAIRGTDANTGVFFPAADTVALATGGSERMRIDSAGNVGIGTSSPNVRTEVSGTEAAVSLRVNTANSGNSASNYSEIQLSDVSAVRAYWRNLRDGSGATIFSYNDHLRFQAGSTERARITSGGVLCVGDTATGDATGARIQASTITNSNVGVVRIQSAKTADSADTALSIIKQANDSTTAQVFVRFLMNAAGNGQGQINANGANTAAFGSYSDARLKENIVDLPSQLANICALRPVEFDYIESEGGGHQIGFIAQEIEQIYPDVVGERSDGMKTVTAWSKTEARLVKAIQEQQALIQQLTERVAALEAKGA